MELNYEKDLAIDSEALDVEWLGQAELMRRYTRHAADMKKQMDETKERLDVTKAQLDMGIRSAPSHYGLEKVTEGALQSIILLQPQCQKLSQAYIDAKYEYDIAVGAVRAVDQRKDALENLVRLLNASYFAGPQTPRDLSRERLEAQNRRQQNAKIQITRGRKAPG